MGHQGHRLHRRRVGVLDVVLEVASDVLLVVQEVELVVALEVAMKYLDEDTLDEAMEGSIQDLGLWMLVESIQGLGS